MKITNKQFVEKYLIGLPANDVMALLDVTRTLLVRHKIAYVQAMEGDASIKDLQLFLTLLSNKGKLNRADVASLIRMMLAGAEKLKKRYMLTTSNEELVSTVGQFVDKGSELDVQHSNEIGLMLQGE